MLKRSHSSIHKQIYDRIAYLGTVSKADLLEYFTITSSSMTRILEDMLGQKRSSFPDWAAPPEDASRFCSKPTHPTAICLGWIYRE